MKAVVKVAYFDSTGLHRPGEIVDVKSPSRLVEVIKVTSSKKEEPKVEIEVKTVEVETAIIDEPIETEVKTTKSKSRRKKKG
jgi:hypothetical protein